MSTTPVRELHGREPDLALIRDELERLAEGNEVVVVIEGPAGMGKSRLSTR
jgi:predicted ATPase